jgi:hypothetical protein
MKKTFLTLALIFLMTFVLFAQNESWEVRSVTQAENDSLTAATIYLPDADGWEMVRLGINFDNVDAYMYADSLADTTNYAVWQVNLGTPTAADWVTISTTATNIKTEATDYKISLSNVCYPAIRLKYYNASVGESVKARLIFYK